VSARLVLVTGGCGFIGRHLSTRLRREGYGVRVLDCLSPQVHGHIYDPSWMDELGIEFLKGSVCDSVACLDATENVEAVVHLAAETGTGQSMYEMSRYMDTNVTGSATLLEACARRRIGRIVLSSSRAVYGEGMWQCGTCGVVHPSVRSGDGGQGGDWGPPCPKCKIPVTRLLPTSEDAQMDPASVYGISKLAQELLVWGVQRVYPAKVSILRFFNVFGPGQSLSNPYTGVLAVFANRAREDKVIDLYEDGEILRDFVFVDDAVEALLAGLDVSRSVVCNVGSGQVVSIRHLAEAIVAIVGSSSDLIVTNRGRVGDVRGLQADIRAAERVLGWTPTVTLDEGLRRFLDWASSQPYEDRYEQSLSELCDQGLYR
jgi:dTDP-L-rhamnose 4-epimerase